MMQIERETGTVLLPNGYSMSPDLTQEGFRSGDMFRHARSQDYGTSPWVHYHFPGGRVEDVSLHASLCFYDQRLVTTSLLADLYPPGSRDGSSYSLDIDAATKDFHDRLLLRMLGKPTRVTPLSAGNLAGAHKTLARPRKWEFRWGMILSGYDAKGGETSITISYGNRLEEANRAFRYRPPQ